VHEIFVRHHRGERRGLTFFFKHLAIPEKKRKNRIVARGRKEIGRRRRRRSAEAPIRAPNYPAGKGEREGEGGGRSLLPLPLPAA
jgi:hypothetical protein